MQVESSLGILVTISTGLELMGVDSGTSPTKVGAGGGLDLGSLTSGVDTFVNKALRVLVDITLFEPQVIVLVASGSFTFQAPLSLTPFLCIPINRL